MTPHIAPIEITKFMHCRRVGSKTVGDDLLDRAVPFQHLLHKAQCRRFIAGFGDIALQHLVFVVNCAPQVHRLRPRRRIWRGRSILHRQAVYRQDELGAAIAAGRYGGVVQGKLATCSRAFPASFAEGQDEGEVYATSSDLRHSASLAYALLLPRLLPDLAANLSEPSSQIIGFASDRPERRVDARRPDVGRREGRYKPRTSYAWRG